MNIGDLIVHVYGNKWVTVIFWLMIFNLASGIVVSLYKKEFYLAVVGDWLLSRALPYIGVAGILQGILIVVPQDLVPDMIRPLTGGFIWGTVVAALIGHILDTLQELPFVNLPSFLRDKPKADVTSGT